MKVSVRISFGQEPNYFTSNGINSTRIARLMNSDQSSATAMGFWDKFKDMFRPHKKADALKELHTLIHSDAAGSKFDAFNKLKSYADDAFQGQFKKTIDDAGNIIFSIGDHQIASCDLRDEVFVAMGVDIPPMAHEDQELFLFMLDWAHLMRSGQSSAAAMGPRDRFLDMFRPHKKVDALRELHTLIHSEAGGSKFDAFNKLKAYAGDAFQDQFKRAIDDTGNIIFSIDGHKIASCDLRDEIFVARDVDIPPMSHEDRELFLFMLDRARVHDKEPGSDFISRKGKRYADTNGEIYKRYRPGEKFEGGSITMLKKRKFERALGENGAEMLKLLSTNPYQIGTRFARMGYRTDESGTVKFEMMHPLHIFMRGTYVNINGVDDGLISKEDMCERNTVMLKKDVQAYYQYNSDSNKLTIDDLLGKIYEGHGNTLRIADRIADINRNALI